MPPETDANNAALVTPVASNVDHQTLQVPLTPVAAQPQPNPDNVVAPPNGGAGIVEKAPETPAGEQTPADGSIVTPPENQAAIERLKQQTARNNKLLSALGVDPMSDLGEQLESGLITPEMLQRHILGSRGQSQPGQQPPGQQVQAPPEQSPILQAQLELDAANQAFKDEASTGSISIETNERLHAARAALYDAKDDERENKLNQVMGQITASKQDEQVNESLGAVLSVVRETNGFKALTDNEPLKQIAESVYIAMSGTMADQEARKVGIDPATLRPEHYAYYANKASEKLGLLAEFYIQMGRKQVLDSQDPTRQRLPNITPAGPSGGGVIPQSPYRGVGITNHADAAKRFMATGGKPL